MYVMSMFYLIFMYGISMFYLWERVREREKMRFGAAFFIIIIDRLYKRCPPPARRTQTNSCFLFLCSLLKPNGFTDCIIAGCLWFVVEVLLWYRAHQAVSSWQFESKGHECISSGSHKFNKQFFLPVSFFLPLPLSFFFPSEMIPQIVFEKENRERRLIAQSLSVNGLLVACPAPVRVPCTSGRTSFVPTPHQTSLQSVFCISIVSLIQNISKELASAGRQPPRRPSSCRGLGPPSQCSSTWMPSSRTALWTPPRPPFTHSINRQHTRPPIFPKRGEFAQMHPS